MLYLYLRDGDITVCLRADVYATRKGLCAEDEDAKKKKRRKRRKTKSTTTVIV